VEVFHLFQEIRPVERGKSEKNFSSFCSLGGFSSTL
jgi:hypothetical protein